MIRRCFRVFGLAVAAPLLMPLVPVAGLMWLTYWLHPATEEGPLRDGRGELRQPALPVSQVACEQSSGSGFGSAV